MHFLNSAKQTTLISNQEMDDIMKIIWSFEDACFLIKGTCEAVQTEAKEQKDFLACY